MCWISDEDISVGRQLLVPEVEWMCRGGGEQEGQRDEAGHAEGSHGSRILVWLWDPSHELVSRAWLIGTRQHQRCERCEKKADGCRGRENNPAEGETGDITASRSIG